MANAVSVRSNALKVLKGASSATWINPEEDNSCFEGENDDAMKAFSSRPQMQLG